MIWKLSYIFYIALICTINSILINTTGLVFGSWINCHKTKATPILLLCLRSKVYRKIPTGCALYPVNMNASCRTRHTIKEIGISLYNMSQLPNTQWKIFMLGRNSKRTFTRVNEISCWKNVENTINFSINFESHLSSSNSYLLFVLHIFHETPIRCYITL